MGLVVRRVGACPTISPKKTRATGTPAGVGMGFTPARYLQPGERVAASIEPIATLENPVASRFAV